MSQKVSQQTLSYLFHDPTILCTSGGRKFRESSGRSRKLTYKIVLFRSLLEILIEKYRKMVKIRIKIRKLWLKSG